jgi:hypothetical protein
LVDRWNDPKSGFDGLDFFDPAQMASTLKFGCKPYSHEVADRPVSDEVTWKAEYVHVIVSPTHFRHDLIAARSRPHSLELIGGDGHSKTGSTNQDPSLDGTVRHAFRHRYGIVWVVHRLVAVGAVILHFVTVGCQQSHEFSLDLKTPMIASNSNSHGIVPISKRIVVFSFAIRLIP